MPRRSYARACWMSTIRPRATFVAPPLCEVTGDHDALLGYRAAYAAQMIVLDQCVGGLLTALAEFGLEDRTLLALIGCRGFALGEHGAVGGAVDSLYGELLHVPCLVRSPGMAPAPPRCNELATPRDLGATIASWFGAEPQVGATRGNDLRSSHRQIRSYIRMNGSGGERALRTRAWYLRQAATEFIAASGVNVRAALLPEIELYAKPDDRWEANEVADRCRDVVQRLLAALDASTTEDVDGQTLMLDEDLSEAAR